jgi:glyoxylase-like metal-dependent hydrolase (beta-lactamase superfamily II)
MIDTLLAGRPGITTAYLVDGPRPALVDPGARTTAAVVRAALASRGMGPDDLAWIVPTHVHLDHCGATGILAHAFPRATVVVHERGARHLAEPGRLLAGSVAVYRHRWSIYGGIDPTPAERIVAAPDGHRIDLGGGGALRLLHTPGHARHHASLLHEGSGAVIAGDAVGVRMAGAGLHPALPPPDVDPAAGDASLARLAALDPTGLLLAHSGPSPDPRADIDLARRQLALCAEAARATSGRPALAARLDVDLPIAPVVGDPGAVGLWGMLGWRDDLVEGLALWADGTRTAEADARQ